MQNACTTNKTILSPKRHDLFGADSDMGIAREAFLPRKHIGLISASLRCNHRK